MSKFGVLLIRNFSVSSQRLKNKKYPKIISALKSFEHIYGISSVISALQSKKRIFRSVYIQDSNEKKTTKKKDQSLLDDVLKAAKEANVRVAYMEKGQLNNLSSDKPHQGVVLKASTRDMIEITRLSELSESGSYEASLSKGKSEDVVISKFDSKHEKKKSVPLWIALDEVQDPQNFGSILRSAHFFGVDGIIVCRKNSAPLSPAVSKVSSGAMEVMDIFFTNNLLTFLKESNENGWNIIGASTGSDANTITEITETNDKPTVLVLGNEGAGLRTNIRNSCNLFVRIPDALKDQFNGSVDSLNVGVAAGILIYSFKNKVIS